MASLKNCVFALDTSGSVCNNRHYWTEVENIIKGLPKYNQVFWIIWNSFSHYVEKKDIIQCIKNKYGIYLTKPQHIWNLIKKKEISNYELHLLTDGAIESCDYNDYIRKYNDLNYHPLKTTVYYIGFRQNMNFLFLDCFNDDELNVCVYDVDCENVTAYKRVSTKKLLNHLNSIPEYLELKNEEIVDISNVLTKLYDQLRIILAMYNDEIRKSAEVRIIIKKFVDDVAKTIYEKKTKKEYRIFNELFEDVEKNSKKIFELFCIELKAANSQNFQSILSRILNLCNDTIIDRKLETYGNKWYDHAQQCIETENSIDEIVEDRFSLSFDVTCPILLLDSNEYGKYSVFWISSDFIFGGKNIKQIFETSTTETISIKRKITKDVTKLYDFLDESILNERLAPSNQHISLEAFIGCNETNLDLISKKNSKCIFTSEIHQTQNYALILHNINSKEKQNPQDEKNILIHNFITITELLFGDRHFVGSFSCLYVFFLSILKKCKKLDEYNYLCVEKTLINAANNLKCNIMISSGREPKIYINVKEAILFHAFVYPKEILKNQQVSGLNSCNFIRNHIKYIDLFIEMAKTSFKINFTENFMKNIYYWKFWKFILNLELTKENKQTYLKQVLLTKIQNWKKIDDEIIFIEGPSKGSIFDYLNYLTISEIQDIIEIYEKSETPTNHTFLKIDSTKISNIPIIEKLPTIPCNLLEKKFCKAICDFPIICSETKLLRTKCYEQCRENFNEKYLTYPNRSLFAHSYVRKCKNLIIRMNKNNDYNIKLPSILELKKYIVKSNNLDVYHENIDQEILMILEKIKDWFDWYEKNKDSNLLIYKKDWRSIFNFSMNEENSLKKLKNCSCGCIYPMNKNVTLFK